MNKFKYYVEMLRLRTLPLCAAGVFMGNLLAESFNVTIFVLTLFTAASLQILSNIANEVGDAQKGTDNEQRLGPIRGLQLGILSIRDYYRMIFIFLILSIGFGCTLLYIAIPHFLSSTFFIMSSLGILAIVAAIKYTLGKHAFGYLGLGDFFVFVFYGLVGVGGSYFLATGNLSPEILLPAAAIGYLSAGVLNINNIRDIENDKACGKMTLVVRLGECWAKVYHTILIIFAFGFLIGYTYTHNHSLWGFFYLIILPFYMVHIYFIWRHSGKALNSQLKVLSILTLLLSLLYTCNKL